MASTACASKTSRHTRPAQRDLEHSLNLRMTTGSAAGSIRESRDGAVDFKVYRMPFWGFGQIIKTAAIVLTFNALELSQETATAILRKNLHCRRDASEIEQLSHDKRPASWSVRINISNQIGAIWFDDLQFVKIPQEALLCGRLDSSAYIAGSANAYLNLACRGRREKRRQCSLR